MEQLTEGAPPGLGGASNPDGFNGDALATGARIAGGASAFAQEAQAAIERPAPANATEQSLNDFGQRVAQIEGVLGLARPLADEIAGVVAVAAPSTAPVIARLSGVEDFIIALLHSLGSHFGGKVPLPPKPSHL